MPFTVVSFNIADLPWPFEKCELQQIPNRIDQIRGVLDGYDYRLVQEDWFQRMTGHPCGHWYWFPSGLTLGAPASAPLSPTGCKRHDHSGFASGDWLARKGWQWGLSQGVVFVNLHLDSGDADWPYRQEQALAIRDALPTDLPLVVAGDFNTEKDPDTGINEELIWMDNELGGIGLDRVQITTQKGKDHIYTRGFTHSSSGEEAALAGLSDHPAVRVTLTPI